MTLQSSGAISILDIVGEFGGSGSHSLTEYYRGGAFVPNISENSSIPTSGTISLTDFYGATATPPITVTITNRTLTDGTASGGSTALVSYSLQSNGQLEVTEQDATTNVSGEWASPTGAGVGNDFEVRVTTTGDGLTSGPTGSWISLGTTRTWTNTASGGGSKSTTLTVQIRDSFSQTIQDTASVTLSVTSTISNGGGGK